MVLRYYPIGVLCQVLYMCMYLTTWLHTESVRECISLSCNKVVYNARGAPLPPPLPGMYVVVRYVGCRASYTPVRYRCEFFETFAFRNIPLKIYEIIR